MISPRMTAFFRKDGWILAALLAAVALCLLLGGIETPAAASREEQRLSRVLSAMAGAGDVDVAIHYVESVPCGAVVIAEGADDVSVRIRLSDAVTTLLGVDNARVAVYPRESGGD